MPCVVLVLQGMVISIERMSLTADKPSCGSMADTGACDMIVGYTHQLPGNGTAAHLAAEDALFVCDPLVDVRQVAAPIVAHICGAQVLYVVWVVYKQPAAGGI
jgi:hypothetical protein